MYSGGLTVLIQAQVEDFLEGIQSVHGFTASGKRKKALGKFSQFYFNGEQPELSTAQVQLVLVGDYHESSTRTDKKRTGLVHLCGLLRRKKEQGKAVLTRSATMAIELLDKIICIRTELVSAPVFRDVFSQLPSSLLELLHLDLHVMGRSRKQAFRLVNCVLRYHRISQGESNKIGNYEPVVLEQLLQDDDAHDLYIEWEEEDDDIESLESNQAPAEWDHVMLAENSDDEEENDANVAKNLLAAVLVDDEPKLLNRISEDGQLQEYKAGGVAVEGHIADPLRIRPEDLRTLEIGYVDPKRASMKVGSHKSRPMQVPILQPAPQTKAPAPVPVVVKQSQPPAPPPPPPVAQPQNQEPVTVQRRGSSGATKKKESKRRRFFNKITGKGRSRTGSNASRDSNSPPASPTTPSTRKGVTFDTPDLPPKPPPQKPQQHEQRPPPQQKRTISEPPVKKAQPAPSDEAAVLREILNAGSGRGTKTILPTSDRFDSSLFLYRVHRDTSMTNLLKGLKNMELENEDQKTRMKTFVQENFDEFVHCRQTIGHIHVLMRQETADLNGTSETSKTQHRQKHHSGRTKRVDEALNKALQTSDEYFVPLLQKRKRVRKLRRAADMLSRLEYLWQLPQQLRRLMQDHRWIEAVIEFSKAGQHLNLLVADEETKGNNSSHGFYRDAVVELEDCGVQLCEALIAKLTSGLVFDESQTLSKRTKEALHAENVDHLLCTEALSLLLELRDHVPVSSKIYKMLDEDRDPFILLAKSQQQHAKRQMEEVGNQLETRGREHVLRVVTEMVKEYVTIWEDARVCLDPSSASMGKEHIFDVLNRVKGDTTHVPVLGPAGVDAIDDDGAASSARLRRTGSTDLLFDIRKRSAANCTLEDLAERRKSSDEMAWEITNAYLEIVRSVLELEVEMDCSEAMAMFQEVLALVRRLRSKGTLNAAAHGRVRQLRKLRAKLEGGCEGEAELRVLVEKMETEDIAHVLESLAKSLVGRRFALLVDFVESRVSSDEVDDKSKHLIHQLAISDIQREPPQLPFVVTLIEKIYSTLNEVKFLVRSPDGLGIWRDGFLKHLAVEHSKTLTKCVRSLCEWIAKRSKDVGSEVIPLLFADCHYCRTKYMDQMQLLLGDSTDPRFKFVTKNSKETLSVQLQRQLQRLEEGLMAQYVQQRGKGLKALVEEALLFDHNYQDWPMPQSIRPYTLDILLHFVNVVAECSHRVGPDGSHSLISGLTARLGLVYSVGFAAIEDSIASSQGALLQLRIEILFLRKVLATYETGKSKDLFDSTLKNVSDYFQTLIDPASSGQSPEELTNRLIEDMMKKSRLLRKSLYQI